MSAFVGREAELRAIGRSRNEVASGVPRVVVVEGEAGIGKTALMRRAFAGDGDGLRLCWAGCDPAEQDYPFGVLSQLLRRLPSGTPGVDDLVRCLKPGASPLSAGAALLAVVAAATDAGPLALVVDDVQWADLPSVQALAFALRRLDVEPVLLAVTARTPGAGASTVGQEWQVLLHGTAHVRHLFLSGLDAQETGALANVQGMPRLTAAELARLWERTAGHPLHVRSLLAQITPGQLADPRRPLPLPASLDQLVRHALDQLPSDARYLVEALAVLNATVPLAVAAQVAGVDDVAHALSPAVQSGLVQWQSGQPTTPVRVHHTLQRDAVYQALAPTRRQALHTRAAAVVSREESWAHLVAAATETDLHLVEKLAQEAESHAAQGRLDRAATFQLWAADLSTDRVTHERHLLTAAIYLLTGELPARAFPLHDALEQCAASPRRDAVLGRLATLRGELTRAEHLLESAQTASDVDTRRLAATWLANAFLLKGNGAAAAAALRTVVQSMPPGVTAHRARGNLAMAVGQTDGPRAGARVIVEAGLPDESADVTQADSYLLDYRGVMRVLSGQLRAGTEDLTTLIERNRTDPSIPVLGNYWMVGFARYLTGNLQDAAVNAERALLFAEAAGHTWHTATGNALSVLVHSLQGRWEPALAHLHACRRTAAKYPTYATLFAVLAEAGMEQARADHQAMLHALRPLDDPAAVPPGGLTLFFVLWAPLLVEALTAVPHPTAAHLDRAENILHTLDDLSQQAPALAVTTHWLHARLATAHADTTTAMTHYQAVTDSPAQAGDDIPLHRAFLHHDLARLLAAQGNRDEATQHLTRAHQLHTSLGATPHLQRVNDDLDKLHARPAPALDQPTARLTERERHIAHLAAQGMTNQEIGQELFLSPKTVEYHLSHVYTKLDFTNRRQLRNLVFVAI